MACLENEVIIWKKSEYNPKVWPNLREKLISGLQDLQFEIDLIQKHGMKLEI